jgi:putative hydrolase of the HAD superfamily
VPAAILIDLFNTLIDDGGGGPRDEVTRQMGRALGVDPDAFTGLFHSRWQERLVGRFGPLDVMVRDFAVELGGSPTPEAVQRAAALRVGLTAGLLGNALPSTLTTLDTLRERGFRLAVVSNCTVETAQVWKASPFGTRFDAAALSCELGVGKPDPAIYQWAADALGVVPTDCLFIGDGADGELAGATALGMRVLRTLEFADTDPHWPGPTIDGLPDLLELTGLPG